MANSLRYFMRAGRRDATRGPVDRLSKSQLLSLIVRRLANIFCQLAKFRKPVNCNPLDESEQFIRAQKYQMSMPAPDSRVATEKPQASRADSSVRMTSSLLPNTHNLAGPSIKYLRWPALHSLSQFLCMIHHDSVSCPVRLSAALTQVDLDASCCSQAASRQLPQKTCSLHATLHPEADAYVSVSSSTRTTVEWLFDYVARLNLRGRRRMPDLGATARAAACEK